MKMETRLVGVGCFADERTVARTLRRAVEAYILGRWDGAPASEGVRLLERFFGNAAAGRMGAPFERITGFHLACRGRRLRLWLYSRGGGRTRREFQLDELADLRQSRLH